MKTPNKRFEFQDALVFVEPREGRTIPFGSSTLDRSREIGPDGDEWDDGGGPWGHE